MVPRDCRVELAVVTWVALSVAAAAEPEQNQKDIVLGDVWVTSTSVRTFHLTDMVQTTTSASPPMPTGYVWVISDDVARDLPVQKSTGLKD
jgi:hypothetical protein